MMCLFCDQEENNYKPVPQVDFICGLCVVLLAGADQNELKRAHTKAIEKGYNRKSEAIKSFLILEGIEDEQQKPKSKKRGRHSHRAGITKSARIKKERLERIEI